MKLFVFVLVLCFLSASGGKTKRKSKTTENNKSNCKPREFTTKMHSSIKEYTPPREFDWTDWYRLGDIQNQGNCGGCWAIATVSAVEAHLTIKDKKHKHVKLSAQELLDCKKTDNSDGCDGGLHYEALDYIAQCGISLEKDYPTNLVPKKCKVSDKNPKKFITGYRYLPLFQPNEEEIKKIVAKIGPVIVSISTPRSLKNHKRGVFNDPNCRKHDGDHYAHIVGYGVENGQEYWLVKNSWSSEFGDNGFIKIARNADNMCNIANEVFYPEVE